MDTKVAKKYFVIPVFYLSIIIFLIFLQFSSVQIFKEEIGNIRISGKIPFYKKDRSSDITNLSVSFEGVSFKFSGDSTIEIYENNGGIQRIKIRGYTPYPDGVELKFTEGFSLRFLIEGGKTDKILIIPVLTAYTGNPESIKIPFYLEEDATIETIKGLPVLLVNYKNTSHFLSTGQGSTIDTRAGKILLSSTKNTFSEIVYEEASPEINDPFSYWFMQGVSAIEEDEYMKRVESYLDKAYFGFRTSRFAPAQGGWRTGEGGVEFSERVLVALFSEALKRGRYNEIFSQIQSVITDNRSKLSYLSLPFLGNFGRIGDSIQIGDAEKVEALIERVRQEDRTVFLNPDLILFIVNHGPFSLTQEIFKLAETVNLSEAELKLTLGILRAYLQACEISEKLGSSFSALSVITENKILPAIRRTDRGLFIEAEQGSIDVLQSIEAGKLILSQGKIEEKSFLVSLGREMILSVLRLSDSEGVLPARLSVENNRIILEEGKIQPEDIYTLITDNSYYTREISLFEPIGPGSWILTCAEFISCEVSSERISFSFRFPEGHAHHTIIQGVKPFNNIQLFGINWRSDPTFENYTSGWVYNRETQTLYLKLTHRQNIEEVVLYY